MNQRSACDRLIAVSADNDEGHSSPESANEHMAGRISLTKWGPIIAAGIIGIASVTGSVIASLINRSNRSVDTTVPVDTSAPSTTTSATSTAPAGQASSTPSTLPPQVIIVQVPGSTIVGTPNTVIVTVTVLVPAPTAQPNTRPTTTKGIPTDSTTSTSSTTAPPASVVTASSTGPSTPTSGAPASSSVGSTTSLSPTSASVGTSTTNP
jgi:hypothetical protein